MERDFFLLSNFKNVLDFSEIILSRFQFDEYTNLLKNVFLFRKEHQETECSSCPVTCEKCNKDGIQRGKVRRHPVVNVTA